MACWHRDLGGDADGRSRTCAELRWNRHPVTLKASVAPSTYSAPPTPLPRVAATPGGAVAALPVNVTCSRMLDAWSWSGKLLPSIIDQQLPLERGLIMEGSTKYAYESRQQPSEACVTNRNTWFCTGEVCVRAAAAASFLGLQAMLRSPIGTGITLIIGYLQ